MAETMDTAPVDTAPQGDDRRKMLIISAGAAVALVLVLWVMWILTAPDEPEVAVAAPQQRAAPPTRDYDPAVESYRELSRAAPVPTTVSVRGEGELAVAAMLSQIGTMINDPVEIERVVVRRKMGDQFTIGAGPAETLVTTNFGEPVEYAPGQLVTVIGIVRNMGSLPELPGLDQGFVDEARGYIELNEMTVFGPPPETAEPAEEDAQPSG